jgi:ATP-dependent DNA helicase RecQ
MAPTKEQILKKYFGYDSFLPLQAEIIDHLMAGNDTLALMPTGGGKSVCFQVPALMREGITIVISPLIALMKDQVEALRANGIEAAFLNSTLTIQEEKEITQQSLEGNIKLLYVSPERLNTPKFIDLLGKLTISFFAVDEAHCISAWGHDFRPEYTRLKLIKERFPETPLIALTATADRAIRKDITRQLQIPEANTFLSSFDRPNLSLEVRPGIKRMAQISDFLKHHYNQPGIIYCLSRKSTEDVAAKLKSLGYSAGFYHAGMDTAARSRIQNRFIRDDIQIICATIAFGMGIDKSNVRWIIHYNMPKNLESFYQEIGRSGRDGLPADTLLFYSYADVMRQEEMLKDADPERKELLEAKLRRMKQYAESEICRRRILLSYFNETITKDCGNCDVCRNPPEKFDGTTIAQKALSAIVRTDERINSSLLIDILRGSKNRNVVERKYDEIKTWGVGKDLRAEEWSDYIFQLLNSGYIDIAYDEGYTLKLNTLSRLVLTGKEQVSLVAWKPYEERKKAAPEEPTKRGAAEQTLFEQLREFRKKIAEESNIPAYMVFNDKTLMEMAQKIPSDRNSMMEISGVGEKKFATYGEEFLGEIRSFMGAEAANGTRIKGATAALTYEMFSQGKSVEEISAERKLLPSTILTHLITMKEKGCEVNLQQFIGRQELEQIRRAIEATGGMSAAVKPIFDHLEGQIDYGTIKIGMAIIAGE